MTKEQIKKAVDEYIGYPPEMDEGIETTMRRNAFKDGANWRINSVWHDAEERPKFPGKVELVKFLLLFKNGECGYSQISKDDWDDIKEVAKFVKWAYVGDLIPSKTERKL